MQEKITAHLKEHGPSTVKELKLALGGSDSTIRKHLKALADSGAVSADDGKYALANGKATGKAKGPSRSHEQAEARDDAVLAIIKKAQSTTAEVAKQAGISESLAYVSIWRLQKLGKVRKVGGRPAAYAAA